MNQISTLQNLNDAFYTMLKILKRQKDNPESVEFDAETLEGLIDEMRELLLQREPVWFDMDAQYYSLDDVDKTPMNVKWIKDGVIRLESEDEGHVVTGIFDGIEKSITKIVR